MEAKYYEIERIHDSGVQYKEKDNGEYVQHVFIKWDGCINIYDAGGGNYHICDIDDFIARLQEIKSLGKDHFHNEYWA